MKSKTQIALWLIVVILFCIAFMIFSDTLALFETDSSGVVNSDVGKWLIKVNDQSITQTVNEAIEINNFQYSTSSKVETGYIAPGGNAYFDLIVDATECDVAVLYTVDLNLSAVDYDANIEISLQDMNGNSVVRTGEYDYSGIISLDSINNNETRTIRVTINWVNDDSKNASDTLLGEVEDSKLTIPIKFHARQYLGETLVPYSG